MNLRLDARATGVQEAMDDPDCDPEALRRTYARFTLVNRLVSGWRRRYVERLRPLLSTGHPTTLLDLGFGGGDLPRALSRWARADGLRLAVTAVDPDPRAYAYVAQRPPVPGVTFRQADSSALVAGDERFDVVVSNHLLHHLGPAGLVAELAHGPRLARRLVLHSDLRRSRLAYLAWAAVAWPTARDSFVYADGLLSIRRSYRPAELAGQLPVGWRVEPEPPFRLLLSWEPSVSHGG